MPKGRAYTVKETLPAAALPGTAFAAVGAEGYASPSVQLSVLVLAQCVTSRPDTCENHIKSSPVLLTEPVSRWVKKTIKQVCLKSWGGTW